MIPIKGVDTVNHSAGSSKHLIKDIFINYGYYDY